MQLSIGTQSTMLVDPACQELLDAMSNGYYYNEYSKANHVPVIEAHQYALLEVAQGENEVNLPIIEHKIVQDDLLGY